MLVAAFIRWAVITDIVEFVHFTQHKQFILYLRHDHARR